MLPRSHTCKCEDHQCLCLIISLEISNSSLSHWVLITEAKPRKGKRQASTKLVTSAVLSGDWGALVQLPASVHWVDICSYLEKSIQCLPGAVLPGCFRAWQLLGHPGFMDSPLELVIQPGHNTSRNCVFSSGCITTDWSAGAASKFTLLGIVQSHCSCLWLCA